MKTMKTMMISTMVVVLLVCTTGAWADSVVFQDGLMVNGSEYWDTQDVKLHSGAPDDNFDAGSTGHANTAAEAYWRPDWRGYAEHTLIKFEGLNFLSGQYISIDSVTLTLRSTDFNASNVDIYIQQVASSNDWDEDKATWNENDGVASTPWASGVAGLEGAGDTTGTISTLSITALGQMEYVFDLDTAVVAGWIEGGFGNAGMIIRPDVISDPSGTTTDPINFWASNYFPLENRPMLTINYTPIPEPMTMSLIALGGLAMLRRRK